MQRGSKALIGAFTLVVAGPAMAFTTYVGTPDPQFPAPSPLIPLPTQVTGKEYTDLPNISTTPAVAVIDSGQVIAWDGVGGVGDSVVDFIGGDGDESLQVDAIGSHLDALLGDRPGGPPLLGLGVRTNAAALLVSHTGDGAGSITPLYTEHIAGPTAPWATDPVINGHDAILELDGIEVWGLDGLAGDDSDRFSLLGDPFGISVYQPGAVPYITKAAIATAIGLTGPEAQNLDLDALMINDDGDAIWGNTVADAMIFSIRPIGPFDGGEVWDWQPFIDGPGPAPFLFHGGHLWDTAFSVSAAFGDTSENIDGLEGIAFIPEPASLALLTGGAIFLLRPRRVK